MKNLIGRFDISEVIPSREAVLRHQGISRSAVITEKISTIYDDAMEIFANDVAPVYVSSELIKEEFELIFRGEGENEEDNPVKDIMGRASSLSLYALTMGEKVSRRIEELFERNDFAPGAMLDAIASVAADTGVDVLENNYSEELKKRLHSEECTVLGYSPGYCGWHISGQKKLFDYLEPDRIGISLNSSFLMSPLKSVTGLLVAGRDEIHVFSPDYTFCESCRTRTCSIRMKTLNTDETVKLNEG